ncbi:hypothetical protein HF325_004512 [Metschnikowia pulcherrima]|uniref:MICOS complex subunit n=1 Tax=Metschnikowia pulcherrima TaxID=27326 RepID=A0A8H7GP48_9ASCO|nr:hypothetical protein HF325_004512 [Metschnikowia pulcherrima]
MARRSFYEDDELVTTKPGMNAEIQPELREKESSHGNISFVDGMGVRTTPYLERHSNALREFIRNNTRVILAELGTQQTALRNEWLNLKAKIDETILDPVFPGIVSLLFPVLATNVFVARRALPYNMPLTYLAAKGKLLAWEKQNLPEFYQQRHELVTAANVWVDDARVLRAQAKS